MESRSERLIFDLLGELEWRKKALDKEIERCELEADAVSEAIDGLSRLAKIYTDEADRVLSDAAAALRAANEAAQQQAKPVTETLVELYASDAAPQQTAAAVLRGAIVGRLSCEELHGGHSDAEEEQTADAEEYRRTDVSGARKGGRDV